MAQRRWSWVLTAALCAIAAPLTAQENPSDRAFLQGVVARVLEFERTGTETPWTNPETENSGSITITRTYFRDPETPCRDYFRTTQREGGKPFSVKGTGCRQKDGAWELSELRGRGAASGTASKETESGPPQTARKDGGAATAPPSANRQPDPNKAQSKPRKPQPAPKPAAKKPKPKPSVPTIVARLPQASDEWEPNGGASGSSGGASAAGSGSADGVKVAMVATPDAPPSPHGKTLEAALAEIPAADKLALPFDPEVGKTIRYEMINEKTIVGLTRKNTLLIRSDIELTTLSKNEEGYVHRYAVTEAKVDPSDDKIQERLLSFDAMMSEVAFSYQSNAAGAPAYIRDWDDVKAALDERYEQALRKFDRKDKIDALSPEQQLQWQAAFAMVKAMFADLDEMSGNARLLRVPRLLFFAAGTELPKESTVEYTAEVFAPSLGRNIDVVGKYWFESIDEEAGTAEVGWEQRYDPEGISEASGALFDELSEEGGAEDAEGMLAVVKSFKSLDVFESGRFKVDLSDGMPVEIAYERVVGVGDVGSNTDSMVIKRLNR